VVKSAELEAVFDAIAERLGGRAERDRPLGPLTTYGVGGPAALFVEIDGPPDVEAVQAALFGSPLPVWVIGRGSNLLVADAGFTGVVVRLGSGFNAIELPAGPGAPGGPEDPVAKVGASVPLPVLARQAAEAGWAGLTWAVGVPGSVGGAVRMNAGGHGSDMAACVKRYTWVDLVAGTGGTDEASRLRYGYRRSSVGPSELVLAAELVLIPGEPETEKVELATIVRWRREHQPGGANAGSVFTNPKGDSAGRLIEQCGLKGHRLGSAMVSEKHANFIQADKGGRADDVRTLMDHVRDVVAARTGVTLTPEVRQLGFEAGETGDVSGDMSGAE
jgi:UDP-N-acetylmuramate dehydrogenase